MKVRHKKDCQSIYGPGPFQVVEESPSYYLGYPVGAIHESPVPLHKSYYEPVPDERWEDVTAMVTVRDLHDGCWAMIYPEWLEMGERATVFRSGYRLRKVRMEVETEWAIKVERKVSP